MNYFKDKIAYIFFGLGFCGAFYAMIAGLVRTDGKQYLNSALGSFLFAGSCYSMLVGALICGKVGARGMIVRRDEHPFFYWIIIITSGLFATLILVDGLKN